MKRPRKSRLFDRGKTYVDGEARLDPLSLESLQGVTRRAYALAQEQGVGYSGTMLIRRDE